MRKKRRILVVGGGVIGLSIAQHLLEKGMDCTVLDRGPFAKEASWAGAGYLDLRSAAKVGGDFFRLCRLSYDLFGNWAEALGKAGGVDPEYVRSGSLDLAFNEEEEAAIRDMAERLKVEGFEGQWLSPPGIKVLEPGLGAGILRAFYFKETAQVRPPRLARALLQVLRKGGAELREMEPVEDFLLEGRAVKGVRTPKGELRVDGVILAAGAWSGSLAEKLGVKLPSRPFRGQVVMYRARPGDLKHILFNGIQKKFTYLVPRSDGRIYVGSTLEDAGFEKTTTPEGMEKLKGAAHRLLPKLSGELIEDTWAGLRPGSIDGWPYLGAAPGLEALWIAAGHFTHGLLLSCATGKLMAELVAGEKPALDLVPFAADRSPHPAAGI